PDHVTLPLHAALPISERLEAAGVALEAQVDANVRAEASLKEAIQQLEQHRLAWQQGLSERSEEIARLSHLLLQAQDHGHRLESEDRKSTRLNSSHVKI